MIMLTAASLFLSSSTLGAPLPSTPSPSYFLASTSLVSPAMVTAQESEEFNLSYTYLEVGATQFDPDTLNDEADSYYGRAQIALGMFHIFGDYQNLEFDVGNTDSQRLKIGAGLHGDTSNDFILQADVAWVFADTENQDLNIDEDDHGWELRGGARWLPVSWGGGGLEIEGNVIYVDVDDSLSNDGQFGGELAARFHFIDFLSVGGTYRLLDDSDEIAFGLRASF